jgi:23S rRNA (pseudouridine1915-N3)-methyltransferase
VAVGHAKAGPAKALFEEYATRLAPPLELIEVEERRKLPELVLRDREAELLTGALPQGAFSVLMDESGNSLTTRELATKMTRWRDAGQDRIAFMIGGASGHGKAAKARADYALSLGALTWPHMLVRVMLAEQIYRVSTLLAGHPYHRG